MIKNKFSATVGVVLCVLGMTGCSNDMEKANTQVGKQVTMTMQTAEPETRANYQDGQDAMSFSWSNGDKISVVVNGVAGNENCELTTSEQGKRVSFSGSVTNWIGTKDIYAFYPYQSAGYVVADAGTPSTATAVLTLPNTQLYTVDGAISNSFMVGVGTATATGSAIDASASMKQVMSFVRLNITNAPGSVTGVKLICAEAIFPTTATVKLSDATITNPGGLTKELSMTVTDNPSSSKSISFAMFPANLSGKEIGVEVTFADGKVKTIKKTGTNFLRNTHYVFAFDATGASLPAPQVYDFYYSDGSWSTNLNANKTCIGIVFKVGKDDNDASSYTQKGSNVPMTEIKGYVLALTDVSANSYKWSPTNSAAVGTGVAAAATPDFNGYKNTKTIEAYATTNGMTLVTDFPATYQAINYESTCTAPSSSSGWFLPSVGQCQLWSTLNATLRTKIRETPNNTNADWGMNYYASSSEDSRDSQNIWCLQVGRGCNSGSKGNAILIRSCLAF